MTGFNEMDYRKVAKALAQAKANHPFWFAEFSEPISDTELDLLEKAMALEFPPEFRAFASQIGTGPIRSTEMFTMSPSGTPEILKQNERWGLPNFLIFGDNGCGDLFGFLRDGSGMFGSAVHLLDHETGEFSPTHESFFSFIWEEVLQIPPETPHN